MFTADDAHDERRATSDEAALLGQVRCFVPGDDLRRLLSLMAGTELVSEMVQQIFSPSECTRPAR